MSPGSQDPGVPAGPPAPPPPGGVSTRAGRPGDAGVRVPYVLLSCCQSAGRWGSRPLHKPLLSGLSSGGVLPPSPSTRQTLLERADVGTQRQTGARSGGACLLVAEADSKQETRALSAARGEDESRAADEAPWAAPPDGKPSPKRARPGRERRQRASAAWGPGPRGEAAAETPAQGLGGVTGSLGLLGRGGAG